MANQNVNPISHIDTGFVSHKRDPLRQPAPKSSLADKVKSQLAKDTNVKRDGKEDRLK